VPQPDGRMAREASLNLRLAGFTHDDPALTRLREWNAAASARQIVHVETRRGQFGATRPVRLDDLTAGDTIEL
jgi:hypothetical protein